jgi:DUF2905 family protein
MYLVAMYLVAGMGHPGTVNKDIGPWLVGIGVVAVLVGGLAWAGWLSWLGRLPGDIRIGGAHTRLYIPITSMLLVSVVLSVLLAFLRRR